MAIFLKSAKKLWFLNGHIIATSCTTIDYNYRGFWHLPSCDVWTVKIYSGVKSAITSKMLRASSNHSHVSQQNTPTFWKCLYFLSTVWIFCNIGSDSTVMRVWQAVSSVSLANYFLGLILKFWVPCIQNQRSIY